MKTKEIIEFLKDYDLGFGEGVWTIAKKSLEQLTKEQKQEVKE